MYEIISKQVIGNDLRRIEIYAPVICSKAKPGQFVVVMPDEKSFRIALAIAEINATKETITLIFKEDSISAKKLGNLWIGDSALAVLGPLGVPSEIDEFGNVLCIGHEIGVVSLLPVCRALHKVGNKVISVLGTETKRNLCLEPQIHLCSQKSYVMSEDGSTGKRGYISDALSKIFEEQEINRIYISGPLAVIQEVLTIIRDQNVMTRVLINPLTIDGFGICGSDMIKIDDQYKFVSVDGPEFDASQIDFKFLEKREKSFKK